MLQTTGGADECMEQSDAQEYNVAMDVGLLNRDPIVMYLWVVEQQSYDDVSLLEKRETDLCFSLGSDF